MMKGLKPDQVPAAYNIDHSTQNSQLPGYGQISLEGQIQTDDETLRDRIRCLQKSNEVFILWGDHENSLVSKSSNPTEVNEQLMKKHLSCMVVPHNNFRMRHMVKSSYLGRYLAIFVLYKTNQNLYTIQDDTVRAFYI